MTTALTTLESKLARLDEIAGKTEIFAATGSPFSVAVAMATSISEIRTSLTDEFMNQTVMPLMNSKLGFRTDKDPNRPAWNPSTRRMEAPEPYPIATVRECTIEAILRGLLLVGNCWNIISGQTYVTKEGFWFLIGKRVPNLTDFKASVSVPKMIRPAGDARNASDEEAKGAVVICSATWRLNGVADKLEREIPIRVNAKMGADAIMGKAERKLLAACYAQITGTVLSDADTSETVADPEPRAASPRQEAPTGEPINPFAAADTAPESPSEPEPPSAKPETAPKSDTLL